MDVCWVEELKGFRVWGFRDLGSRIWALTLGLQEGVLVLMMQNLSGGGGGARRLGLPSELGISRR